MRKLRAEELQRADPESFRKGKKIPVKIILDNIRSGNNTGSIFRSCDAFAAEEIILLGLTPAPPHREILKTALGATETVAWRKADDARGCLEELRKQGYTLIAIEQTSDSHKLGKTEWPERCAVILGNEVEGVSEDVLALCDYAVEIPQFGTKHSLNVAVAGGIVLWEISRYR